MEQGDFDLLKDIPGFKAILRAILKSQMKHLVEQLSKHGGEEAMVLTTSIVDGSFYQLGSAGAEGFLESRDELKSQFLGYCLKNVHQQQTEQSHDAEKTVERTKDKTGLNISPGSSNQLVSPVRKQSESTVLPVSLTRVAERTLSETDTYQTAGSKAGSPDLSKRKGRGRRKRPSETFTSEKQVKRAALAEAVTYPPKAVQASVESSQGITVVTSDSVKIKEDTDAEGAKAIHPKDAFNILPLNAEAEGAKVIHPKHAFNILPRHTESETSENKDDIDTRESNDSEEPDQSMDDSENQGVLTNIKVEPADQEELADVEESTSQSQFDYGATAAEGEDGANDSVMQQSGNFTMDAIPSVCRYCGKAFGRQSTLRQHEMRHRGEGPYTCTECDVVCFSKGAHTRHIVSHSKIRTFKCKICSNTFASQLELERHERREAKDFKYKCSTCERKFEEKKQLEDHVGRHTGEKKHSCRVCNKAFRFRSNMNRHLKIHEEKYFECSVCQRKFSTGANLNAHKKRHLDMQVKCDICGQTFKNKSYLTKHMKRHE